MTKYEQDWMVASNKVHAELKVHDLENVVEYDSELWRYLRLLEYNDIKYEFTNFLNVELIYIITDYTIASFDYQGNQLYIRRI